MQLAQEKGPSGITANIRRALITGGSGFIGSHLVDRLLERGEGVTVYDNLSSGHFKWIEAHIGDPRFRFVHADVLDLERLCVEMSGHHAVWHLAANGDIRRGFQETDLDINQSVIGTRNVLEAMRRTGVRDILFSSSGSVYGETGITPTPETAGPLLPLSFYAAAKLSAEAFISAFSSLFGLRGWIFRFGNVVGTRMSRGVTHDFIRKLRANPAELEVLGDGMQEKPYFTVGDCISGMLHAYERIPLTAEKCCDIFNLGCASRTTVARIARIVIEEMELPNARIRYTGGRQGWPGDQPQVDLSFEKMERNGWTSSLTSDEAVRQTAHALIQAAGV